MRTRSSDFTIPDSVTLVVFRDLFATFSAAEKKGLKNKWLEECEVYSQNFEKTYIKTFDKDRFTGLPSNVEHLPLLSSSAIPARKFFYFFLGGVVNYKAACCVEVVGATAIFAAWLNKIRGAKLFLFHPWSLSVYMREHKKPVLSFLAKNIEFLAFRLADVVAVTTPTLGEEAARYTKREKIYLLPNYVDTELFRPMSAGKEHNLLVFVGRLHEAKNLHMLLSVMKQLHEYKLWIIGDGPQRGELVGHTQREEIENVKFLGTIANQDLPHYLNQAEAFILVSHSEGHPVSMIEAMACGLPCIGAGVPGIKDVIIDGQTGLLCHKSVEGIKGAILRLFSDKGTMAQMGQKAREFAVEHYSKDKILERRIKLVKCELDGIEPLFGGNG